MRTTDQLAAALLLLALATSARGQDFWVNLEDSQLLDEYGFPEGSEVISRESPPAPEPEPEPVIQAAAQIPVGQRRFPSSPDETYIWATLFADFDPDNSGSRKLNEKDIEALAGAIGDPNELLEIMANTQFDNRRGRLNADTAGDLAPEEVSIAGARTFENNFLIDGVSTNNQLDSSGQRGDFNGVTASSQAVFVDTDLLKSFEVLDSNVSAEYGEFLGGVVKAETRDPKDKLSFSLSGNYSSSAWVQFLLDDEKEREIIAAGEAIPGKTEFDRRRIGVSVDIPFNERMKMLVSASRQTAVVTRGALSSSYFAEERSRDTVRDNFLVKLLINPTPESSLTFQTLLTPYEDQYWRSNISRQFGGGSSSKIGWTQKSGRSNYSADLSFTTAENSREEDPAHYIYANTPSITWIPGDIFSSDTARNSGLAGGFGDLDTTQETLELKLKHGIKFKKSSLNYGLQTSRLTGSRARPETNFNYRVAETDSFRLRPDPNDPDFVQVLPIVFDGPEDGSVIQGEQFLTRRDEYTAYEAEAEIYQLNLYADYSYNFELTDWLSIKPSAGLRYSYDNFLDNHNIAPRLNLGFSFPKGIGFNIGANRYYAKNQLAYALREQNPPNLVYSREGNFDVDSAGNLIYRLEDWELSDVNIATTFGSSDLNTPYTDEISLALTLPIWELGEFRVKAIQRDNKDGFARSEAIPDTFIDENGNPKGFDRFELTNRGSSEYRSLSFEWSKTWKNHTFSASTTFSENIIAPGTDTLFSNTDLGLEDEFVYYNGQIVDYSTLEVQRENFNTPFYVAFSWISTWLDDALTLGFRGRFRDTYTTVQSTDSFVDANGDPGSGFELFEDVTFDTQFIIDASISYTRELPRIGSVDFDLNIDNIFNSTPNVAVTRTNPYQAGRAFSLGAKYKF